MAKTTKTTGGGGATHTDEVKQTAQAFVCAMISGMSYAHLEKDVRATILKTAHELAEEFHNQ